METSEQYKGRLPTVVTCCKRMLQESPCYERHTQALFLICDRKHDEINPVRKVTRFKNVPMSAEWTVDY